MDDLDLVEPEQTETEPETKYWIHPNGYFYQGDETEGARAATEEEINAYFNPVKTIDELAAEIEAKYQPKLDMYLRLIILTIAADGETQGAKTIEHQNSYKALADKMNAEIDELYLGGA